jgi:rhodanese-related sulfurtransferase
MKNLLVLLLALAAATPTFAQTIPPFPTRPVPKAEGASTHNLELADWEKLRADTNRVVLDVRTADEFAAGHIPGAVNIDFRAKNFVEAVAKLDKSRPYLVYCASGGRSAKACTQMDGLKFKDTANLLGGIKGWEAGGNTPVKTP